eukprot:375012-Pyramimonas_sp.AAC.1
MKNVTESCTNGVGQVTRQQRCRRAQHSGDKPAQQLGFRTVDEPEDATQRDLDFKDLREA